MNKNEYRTILRNERKIIPTNKLIDYSNLIFNKITSSQVYKDSQVIFCYISYNSEIITTEFINYAIKDNKQIVVPYIYDKSMFLSVLNDLNETIINRFNILQPENYLPVDINTVDLAIVPGLGFNIYGFRIGYGGGYYDRFLSEYKQYSIGVAMSEFLISDLPFEDHDKPVDFIVTEKNNHLTNYSPYEPELFS